MWGKPQGVPANNDVVTAPVVSDAAVEGHPCPKPLKWATGSIVRLCPVDGTVLDPFAGSGTTLRGAKDMGRRAIGIEDRGALLRDRCQALAQDVLDLGVAA
jgi:DNA modification methylase